MILIKKFMSQLTIRTVRFDKELIVLKRHRSLSAHDMFQPFRSSLVHVVSSKKKASPHFLGSVSDKIVPWLRARFERKEGGKTAIQEVIKLYAFDFPRDSIYFPLESFQVGQLVRQAFPNIELCKVTNADRKRLRCYKVCA